MSQMAYVIMRSLVFAVVSFSLFACATPQTMRPGITADAVQAEAFKQKCLLVREEAELQTRLMGVGLRVAEGANLMSAKRKNLCGFIVAKRIHFPNEKQALADAVFSLGDRAKIIIIAPGSPAEKAGLSVGDEVITINEQSIPDDPNALKELLDKSNAGYSVKIAVARNGEAVSIEINPVSCSDCPIALLDSAEPNAYADGQKVCVTKGLMRLANNDDELAMVLSHEMAHHIRKHHDMTKKNAYAGAAFGFLLDLAAAAGGVNTNAGFAKLGMQAGRQAYSKDMEAEADYVGLYILANTEYNIENGPNFFRRLGVAKPRSIEAKYATTHPSTPERFVMLEQTIKEIEMKRSANMPLLPEEKPKSTKQASVPSDPAADHGTASADR